MDTFVGDTPRIIIKTGIVLTGYDTLWIKFKRPDDTTGHWVATIHSTPTWLYYDCTPADLNMPGVWALEAHAHDPAAPGIPLVQLHGKPFNLDVAMPLPETTKPPTTAAPTTLAPTTLAP